MRTYETLNNHLGQTRTELFASTFCPRLFGIQLENVRPTGMCSMLPSAVIKDDQNPRTPLGRWDGDIAMDTLNRISEMLRTLIKENTLFEIYIWKSGKYS